MSKQINTGYINDPSVGQPWTGPELDFVQANLRQVTSAIIQSLTGDNTYYGWIPYVLYGMKMTYIGGTNFSISPGFVWLGDVTYYYPGTNLISINNTAVVTVVTSAGGNITYSDGNVRNPLEETTVTVTDAVSGSGNFNFNQMVYIIKPAKSYQETMLFYQTWGSAIYAADTDRSKERVVCSLTTPNDGYTRNFRLTFVASVGSETYTGVGTSRVVTYIKRGGTVLVTAEHLINDKLQVTTQITSLTCEKIELAIPPNTTYNFYACPTAANGATYLTNGSVSMIEI